MGISIYIKYFSLEELSREFSLLFLKPMYAFKGHETELAVSHQNQLSCTGGQLP